MDEKKDIGSLEESLSERKLKDEMHSLKKIILTSNHFVPGYVACDASIFDDIANYVAENLSIAEGSMLCTDLCPSAPSLMQYFEKNIEIFARNENDLIMVRAKGFEKIELLKKENMVHRIAHDCDQDLVESMSRIYEEKNVNKKIIVLTNISHSSGSDAYENAVKSAYSSEFKCFIYEIKNSKI